MKEKIKGIVILILIITVIYLGYNFLLKKDTYQGIYYPNGCLICDNYIVSPELKSAEDCVKWAENIKSIRNNLSDTWECGKNCRWENGLSICKETFGMEGTGDHSLK